MFCTFIYSDMFVVSITILSHFLWQSPLCLDNFFHFSPFQRSTHLFLCHFKFWSLKALVIFFFLKNLLLMLFLTFYLFEIEAGLKMFLWNYWIPIIWLESIRVGWKGQQNVHCIFLHFIHYVWIICATCLAVDNLSIFRSFRAKDQFWKRSNNNI